MNKFIKITFSLLIVVLSFSSIYVQSSDYLYQTYIRVNPITKEEEIIDTREINTYDELMTQMSTDYFNIYSQNEDVVGWLNIPNIGYYPVTMGENNQYYLTHNEYKEKNTNGIPFMNTASNGSFADIALIHGHHIKNGKMFGSLSKYKDLEFFQKNDLISVFDGEYLYIYKPFTVRTYKDGTNDVVVNNMTKEERSVYLKSLYDTSFNKMEDGFYPNFNTQILFLSTCDYTFKNARLLVGCYMVEKIKY